MARPVLIALLVALLAGAAHAQDPVDRDITRARELAGSGMTEKAFSILQSLAEAHPDDRRPHWWLANLLYSKAGRRREAAETIDGFLERHPRDTYALELLVAIADDALAAAEPDVARYAARRLMFYQPNDKNHLYLVAQAFYMKGDRDGAREACRLLIQDWPSDRDAYLLLARSEEDEGRFEEAAETYRTLIEERPGYARARLALGSILWIEVRDYDAAEQAFRDALDVADDGSADAREAKLGIEAVRADRELAHRLREHRSFLFGLVIAVVCGLALTSAAVAYAARARK
ncbi:MAG: tetratricopeptide repeat protein [Planctomycetota bacterium]